MRFTCSSFLPALAITTFSLCGASAPTAAAPAFSEYSQMFVNTCLQHAPALDEAAIAESASKEKLTSNKVTLNAAVSAQNGRRCSLQVGGGGNKVSMVPLDEAERLAGWFAKRIGATVKARQSILGGPVWYELQQDRTKYEVSVSNHSGVLVFIIALR